MTLNSTRVSCVVLGTSFRNSVESAGTQFGTKRADSVEGVLDLAAGHVAVLRVGAEGDEVLTRHVHLERQTPGGLRGRGAAVPPPRRRPRRASTVDCVPQLVCHLSTQRRLLLEINTLFVTIFKILFLL